jgi:endonuclease YncB( thermonuclease family)
LLVGAAYLLGDAPILHGIRDGVGGPPSDLRGDVHGAVTHVRDGDTVEVEGVSVRVANLNCAERDTAAGQRASAWMRELVAGQDVVCDLEERWSYDREVGLCALASTDQTSARC